MCSPGPARVAHWTPRMRMKFISMNRLETGTLVYAGERQREVNPPARGARTPTRHRPATHARETPVGLPEDRTLHTALCLQTQIDILYRYAPAAALQHSNTRRDPLAAGEARGEAAQLIGLPEITSHPRLGLGLGLGEGEG